MATPVHVTMKEVAERAGVSQATVSMALANHPRLSLATRERVRALAAALRYQPNPYVSALMRARRDGRAPANAATVALINALPAADAWRKSASVTVRQIRGGAMERAAQRGYRAEEFCLEGGAMTPARLSDVLFARGIHGLLLGPMADGAVLPRLRWERFAAVGLSVPQPAINLTTVCNDHYFSSLSVVRECHRRGYRRPALVTRRANRERFQGRWNAGVLVAAELMPDVQVCRAFHYDDEPGMDGLAAWLQAEKPDVLISPNADHVLRELERLRWRVPADVGLAWLAVPAPGHEISGVFQNGELIGATAMDLVLSMVERNERGLPAHAMSVQVEGTWSEGHTLRRAPVPRAKKAA